MTADHLLALAVLGGLLALDVVSVGQFMISRPIVAATAAGVLLGIPGEALFLGVLLEMLALETLPFGASRYLEWSSGAVVGAAVLAAGDSAGHAEYVLAVIAAICTAWAAGASLVGMRKINANRVAARRGSLYGGSFASVSSLQYSSIALDFARGVAVVLVAATLLTPAAMLASDYVGRAGVARDGWIIFAPAAAAAAGAWRMFGSGSRRKYIMLASGVAGTALALLVVGTS